MMTASQLFLRTRLTWLAYIMLAYVALVQSVLGPLMPFLRNEFQLTYTQGGLLPAAMALGLIVSGFGSHWVVQRSSRRMVLWGGSLLLAVGMVLLSLGRQYTGIFIAVLAMGIGSSLAQVMIQALLSDQHGEQRAIALSEANVAASGSATLTPFIIGGMRQIGLDWRFVAVLVVGLLILFGIGLYRVPIPEEAPAKAKEVDTVSTRLPFTFWLYWLALFFVVATEMAVAVWATDYLANSAGLGSANAALAFGAFPAAMLMGRFFGSRFARRWPSHNLLLIALVITLAGFPFFWLARVAALNVLGLFITGLGIANLYPLTLSIAVGLAAEQSNLASARASLGVGTALLSAPLILGVLADHIGIHVAYGIVMVLAAAALVIIVFNRWLLQKHEGV